LNSFSYSESAILYVQGSRELRFTTDGSTKKQDNSNEKSDLFGTSGDLPDDDHTREEVRDDFKLNDRRKMAVYLIDSVILSPVAIDGRLITL